MLSPNKSQFEMGVARISIYKFWGNKIQYNHNVLDTKFLTF